MSTDNWPAPPAGVTGQQIRHRKIFTPPMTTRPVRVGGLEPKVIVAETERYVIYRVFGSGGRDYGEFSMTRDRFEQEFERKSDVEPYRLLVDALNGLAIKTGTVALSINFNRSDIPIDWNDDTGQWEYLGGGE